ncbi:hypothetical protein BX659_1189 [Orenia metallireducens]|jgi:hypothetical protein|uniref:Uncharacterized protein n=1 Tax=Orenia metallireducens TaxID=1413210 RepID=A0A285I5V1_9FIRM|nr:hypothetical protein [Orenia metallireducens]PRX26898.1 hypothetical protein BX659_1189 [Orenia metallireducens]SNY43304.1 hypothetical protein SAMN06265827_13143 [Orenia metallireducens]
MSLLPRIILCLLLIIAGIKLFQWSFQDYKEESFSKNLLIAILDLFMGSFEDSAIGGLLIALLLIVGAILLFIYGG